MNTAEALKVAREALDRAKKLPVWDNVPHALHVELDVIFKAIASAQNEQKPQKPQDFPAYMNALLTCSNETVKQAAHVVLDWYQGVEPATEQQPEGEWVSDKEYWEAPQASQPVLTDEQIKHKSAALKAAATLAHLVNDIEEDDLSNSIKDKIRVIVEEVDALSQCRLLSATSQPSAWSDIEELLKKHLRYSSLGNGYVEEAIAAIRALRQQAPAVQEEKQPQNRREHELKVWPEYYQALHTGEKTFELRMDDRGFQTGDVLHLREWEPASKTYTGREMRRVVSYLISSEWGLRKDVVCMALSASHPAPAQTGEKTK